MAKGRSYRTLRTYALFNHLFLFFLGYINTTRYLPCFPCIFQLPLTFPFLSKTPNSSHFRKGNSIRMETEKAFADHNQSYNTEQNSTERSISSTQDSTKFHLSKALARRAVYGSSSRRGTGNRKVRGNDARALPSRLSKDSLAEDEDSEN
ncbi:hypothetical protein ES288_A07G147900v1 [Gossypium darwinii]|nr:hypothetical protein ES288_A07G147900v1 [Gossypium darwinii]